jgi:enterochelin esterase family protein
VVHDGPEYVRLVRLLDHLAWLTDRDPRLRCRVLALRPVDRDDAYAASDRYTASLMEVALPRAQGLAPAVGRPVGVGASLGALALAHAAATYPGVFAGMLFQSGSFFLPRFDAHERRWSQFDRVVAETARLHADPSPLAGLVVRMTAGLGEENLENNRALAERLGALGVDATLTEGRDGHNHVAWRDLLHPALGDLLERCWAGGATA